MNNDRNELELLSITKVAKMLRLSRKTILGLIYEGKLGTIYIGRRERIPQTELKKFLEENTVRQSILQRRFTSFDDGGDSYSDKDKKQTGFDGVRYLKEILNKEKEYGKCTQKR